jgi:hypothetical protein
MQAAPAKDNANLTGVPIMGAVRVSMFIVPFTPRLDSGGIES